MIDFLMENGKLIRYTMLVIESLITIALCVLIIKTEPRITILKKYPKNVVFRLYIPFVPGWRRHIQQEDLGILLKNRRWTFLLYLTWFIFGNLYYLYDNFVTYELLAHWHR